MRSAELADSEGRFRGIFEDAPLGIAMIDSDRKIIAVNASLEAMLGYAKAEMEGYRTGDFGLREHGGRGGPETQQLFDGTADTVVTDRHYRRKDDSMFPAIVSTSAVRDAQGTFKYGIRTIQDVSERAKAQAEVSESEARFRAIFEGAPLGILLVADESALILDLNAELETMFGYSRGELLGTELRSYRASPGSVRERRTSRAIASGELERIVEERLYRRKDGTEFPALVSTAGVRDASGKYLHSVRTVTDITSRMEIERGKDDFLAMTSHELRTPVTSLHAAVTLVAQGVFGPVSEKAQEMLDIAASNSDRLVTLVNDLIDLERLSLGKISMNFATIDAQALAQEAADLVRPLADAANVQIDVRAQASAFVGDRGRLVQTLQNLLANAIKFSPPGSSVRLESSVDGNTVQFLVSDSGKGIPEDQLESIFESFQQVDSSDTRDAGGSGLGLAIAKAIVERHRGEIRAESQVGQGATFRMELPLAQPLSPGRAQGQ